MITIEFDAINGQPIADGLVEEFVINTLSQHNTDKNIQISVSNALVIDQFRVFVKNKYISNEMIQFLFQGQIINPTSNGRIEKWPKGFCDHQMYLLSKL